jgi:hypothetical protein
MRLLSNCRVDSFRSRSSFLLSRDGLVRLFFSARVLTQAWNQVGTGAFAGGLVLVSYQKLLEFGIKVQSLLGGSAGLSCRGHPYGQEQQYFEMSRIDKSM